MGVPAFFRWLSRKYPSIVVDTNEQKAQEGVKFDNFYLDMNGIIHPCCHPEDRPAPRNEDEMMANIFEYIDRLMDIVRPRRLLYMAIDGVAPRAKMNQQRSRRFRAAKDAEELREQIESVRAELASQGIPLPPERRADEHFDSNCITPGTPFMSRLAVCLRYYIHKRLNHDPAWTNLIIILSNASSPGEGEHKIMDFIRKQRATPGHDPNTQHVLCGADADLIMLGLATHEPNFTIIREEFVFNTQKPCDLCQQIGHDLKDCQGISTNNSGEYGEAAQMSQRDTNFIFIRLSVLREYLARDLLMKNLPFAYDLERTIDDWVFMCFFVGNDFLPHLPSLEIREGAIDQLIDLYKGCVYKTGGYLTKSGWVKMRRVQWILKKLGAAEDHIFRTRQQSEGRRGADSGGAGAKMKQGVVEANIDEEDEPKDNVRLWEDGWKERYYKSKFDVSAKNTSFRNEVTRAYMEGLCWVLRYYYQGVPDWSWFYPYHYAPFASDFVDIGKLVPNFDEDSEPVYPLVQLMSVFPAGSSKHLPDAWANLMINLDSPIIDFYPIDFEVDLNGKKFVWQGVALLPFVDIKRLLQALENLGDILSDEERARNQRGENELFVSGHHEANEFCVALYQNWTPLEKKWKIKNWMQIDSALTSGTTGTIAVDSEYVPRGGSLNASIPYFPDITNNQATVVLYRDPSFPRNHRYSSARLEKAVDPPPTLKTIAWNDRGGDRYRPTAGFNRNGPRAELDIAGKRMLGAGTGGYGNSQQCDSYGGGGGSGQYRNQTDPQYYGNRSGDRYQSNSNRGHGRGGGGAGGGGPSVHWQQAQRHQGAAYDNNYQQRSGYGGNRAHQQGRQDPHQYGSGQGGGGWRQP